MTLTSLGHYAPAYYPVPQNPLVGGLGGLGATDFSLGGSAIAGVPNWILYGGAAVGVYLWLSGGHRRR